MQLNLPAYRRENSSRAWPNTITPFVSLQSRGAGLPELLTSLRRWVTVERGRTETKPDL